ncbi:prostamide/prostaglandin F synthase-like [Diadema antillarum]|uniref:prostamide/prostaglandin F synthase-like n=1 Tax=Diadema antillarum TaxID=105358 RepID=UPI003A8C00D1
METSSKIANNLIKNVRTDETVKLSTLWEGGTSCVIHFMRRFGCPVCRMGARDLSSLKPLLDSANVHLVGIGHEELGAQEFLNTGYWKGELYIDMHKKTYSDLKFKRYNVLNIMRALILPETVDAISKAHKEGIVGNLSGDSLQIGGTLIVDKDGKILLNFKQESPSHHVPLDQILHVLGIKRNQRSLSVDTASSN